MTMKTLPTVKEKISELIEQWPSDKLPELLQLLTLLLNVVTTNHTNGTTNPEPSNELLWADQPWRKYTTILNQVTDWSQFERDIAELRRTTQ